MGTHSEHWGQRLLILLEGEVALRASVDLTTSSLSAVDVDNDGRTEFVTWGGWAGGGGSSGWLAVESYAGGARTLVADFPETESDTCSPGMPDGEQVDAKVLFRSDPSTRAVCFHKRTRTTACPKR